MYYERLMSLAGLEKRAYPQNGYGVNGQQNPPGAPVVQNVHDRNGNLTRQSYTYTETKPWNHNNWNERQAGRTAYNIANSAAGTVKDVATGVSNAWDESKQFASDTYDRAYKGFANWWNPIAQSIGDTMAGAYHGVTDAFGDPNADRFAQNSRVMRENQQQLQQMQQQREKEMEEFRQQAAKTQDEIHQSRQRIAAQQQQSAEDLSAKKQQFSQQRQVDNDAWRQRMDKWNKKFNSVTQGVKPYVDRLNSRPQTPKPASTPAQPSAAVQQIQNNINSTQNPSFQTNVAPAAGAPAVQPTRTSQTSTPPTSQAPKPAANTNWQDPGYWNNVNRPAGRPGY